MITLGGIRNAIWCSVAFVIVASAAVPTRIDRPPGAVDSFEAAPVDAALPATKPQILQASQTGRGLVLTLDEALSNPRRGALDPEARRLVAQLAAFLDEHPERRVLVEGFTDSQGTYDGNVELAQRRADLVAMAIIHSGVDAQRVRAIGYGELFPVVSDDHPDSRSLNRRVEIIVANGNQSIAGRYSSEMP